MELDGSSLVLLHVVRKSTKRKVECKAKLCPTLGGSNSLVSLTNTKSPGDIYFFDLNRSFTKSLFFYHRIRVNT